MDYIRDYRLKGIPFHLSLPPPVSASTPLPVTLSLLTAHPLSPARPHRLLFTPTFFSETNILELFLPLPSSPFTRPDHLLSSSSSPARVSLAVTAPCPLPVGLLIPPSLRPQTLPPASLSFASSSDTLPARCRLFSFAFSPHGYH